MAPAPLCSPAGEAVIRQDYNGVLSPFLVSSSWIPVVDYNVGHSVVIILSNTNIK